jgi:hypothetical protein
MFFELRFYFASLGEVVYLLTPARLNHADLKQKFRQ